MMDYGRDVEFGYFPAPNADDYAAIAEQTRIADETNLDLIGIQDHPYQRRFLDTFSLISDLAARTQRVRFFPDVANHSATNKDDEIIVYCSNVDCLSSVALYRALVERGHRKVRRYAGGLLDWEEAGLILEGNSV